MSGQHWFIRNGDKVNGPFAAHQLRELAEGHRITPDTQVRLEETGNWVAASKVKGLFAAEQQQPPPPIAESDAADKWPASLHPKHESQSPTPVPPVAEAPNRVRRASARQKEYAQSLGIKFSDDITLEEMSKLIQEAVDKRDDEYYHKLDDMEQRGSDAWNRMREEVLAELDEEDCRLSKATPSQMVKALFEGSNLAAILLTMPWDKFSAYFEDNAEGASLNISFGDDLTMEDVEAVILTSASSIMKKRGMGDLSAELEKLNLSLESLNKNLKRR